MWSRPGNGRWAAPTSLPERRPQTSSCLEGDGAARMAVPRDTGRPLASAPAAADAEAPRPPPAALPSTASSRPARERVARAASRERGEASAPKDRDALVVARRAAWSAGGGGTQAREARWAALARLRAAEERVGESKLFWSPRSLRESLSSKDAESEGRPGLLLRPARESGRVPPRGTSSSSAPENARGNRPGEIQSLPGGLYSAAARARAAGDTGAVGWERRRLVVAGLPFRPSRGAGRPVIASVEDIRRAGSAWPGPPTAAGRC